MTLKHLFLERGLRMFAFWFSPAWERNLTTVQVCISFYRTIPHTFSDHKKEDFEVSGTTAHFRLFSEALLEYNYPTTACFQSKRIIHIFIQWNRNPFYIVLLHFISKVKSINLSCSFQNTNYAIDKIPNWWHLDHHHSHLYTVPNKKCRIYWTLLSGHSLCYIL